MWAQHMWTQYMEAVAHVDAAHMGVAHTDARHMEGVVFGPAAPPCGESPHDRQETFPFPIRNAEFTNE